MNAKRQSGSLVGGYVWTFGSTALPLLGAFVVSLIVARTMGPRVTGLVNWVMAVSTIFLIIAKFGVEGAGSRLVSEYEVNAPGLIAPLVRASLLVRLVFTVPTAAVMLALAPAMARFFKEPALLPLLRIGAVIVLTVSVNELAALLVLGLRRFRALFSMRLVTIVVRVGLTAAAALFAWGGAGVLWAYVAATALTAAGVYLIALPWRGGAPAPETAVMRRRLWRLSVVLAVSGASVTIYSMLDKVMIGYFSGATEVGIYAMGRNLQETSLFPMFALVMTLRPALAGAWASGELERCSELVNRSLEASIWFAAVVVTVFACLAGPIVTGLFSEAFAPSAAILLLFLPVIAIRSIGTVILPGLIAADRAGIYAWLTFAGAALNFVLNVVMIPKWGGRGAVVSTFISYLPIQVFGMRTLAAQIPRIWRAGDTGRAIRTVLVSAAVWFAWTRLVPVPSKLVWTIVQSVLITALLTFLLVVVRAVHPDRVREIMRLRGRREGGEAG
jgi:O-antigen/teichoic acid export membrane protein